MIVQIFGLVDLAAAVLLYFGNIPGPGFLVGACIVLLLIKGIMSLYPVPFYLPGFLMNLTDITVVILLYFGTTPLPQLKTVVLFVLLAKSLPSIISMLFLAVGILSSKKD